MTPRYKEVTKIDFDKDTIIHIGPTPTEKNMDSKLFNEVTNRFGNHPIEMIAVMKSIKNGSVEGVHYNEKSEKYEYKADKKNQKESNEILAYRSMDKIVEQKLYVKNLLKEIRITKTDVDIDEVLKNVQRTKEQTVEVKKPKGPSSEDYKTVKIEPPVIKATSPEEIAEMMGNIKKRKNFEEMSASAYLAESIEELNPKQKGEKQEIVLTEEGKKKKKSVVKKEE